MERKFYNIGDSCLCCSIGDSINEATSQFILNAYCALQDRKTSGILDIVPSYKSIAVHYDPLTCDPEKVKQFIKSGIEKAESTEFKTDSKKIEVPVVYNGSDLHRISNLTSLDPEEIIKLHTNGVYTVAMIGFKPHFPYLSGLNSKLHTDRHDSPRSRVPEGSVAIGGSQCGIYPCETPGGWNILGETELQYFNMLKPGDKVIFKKVESL